MNPMFYFLLALTAILAVTASPGEPVLDTHGNIIFGGSYYVLPRITGAAGGGLTLASRGENWCPLYIGQETSEVNMGIPVILSDWLSRVAFVPESANLNIKMDVGATLCPQSTYWHVPPVAPGTVVEALFIVAGSKPLNGFFQIKKIEDALGGYTIVFCVKNNECRDIGIFVDRYGVRRLALSSTPFQVRFMKVPETETSSKPIMSII
ncbi:unnamed protein product [Eruca vesicaria subsp. sativa]|uniref:Uncharacterized protein n=1 Tax=Eruca vesicaria subsp. sativa TaxID=29727 RepID=A0ABC8JPQ4_ERUVS|nr:unnamed protein product [Eruca vesicaria subsp. sativa]